MRAPEPESATLTTVCELARGGMGRVEIAVRRGRSFERLYAVKRLHPHYRRDERFREMFVDEGRIAGLIRHANVVSVLDVGEDDRGPFLVMDYVDGLSLGPVIEHHRERDELLPVQLCVSIGAQIAEGLHAAHELRDARGRAVHVIHRDLSPQNILLGFDGVVRVTDFGVAKALGRTTETATGVLKGKYGYMSPEQLRFEEIDRRSDLFSLGVVLYELLTCRRLYAGKDGTESSRRILDEPPPDLDDVRQDVPPALVELLFQLLAKDRSLRPANARIVAQRLQTILFDLRQEEDPVDLASYMESVFSEPRNARRRKIETALELLDRRESGEFSAVTVASKPTASGMRSAAERPAATPTPSGPPSLSESGSRTGILYHAPGNALAMHGNVLIQVRSGVLSDEVYDAFEKLIGRLAKQHTRAGYVGVIEESAEIPSASVRRRQKQLISTLLDKVDVRLAVVIPGEGVVPKLGRAVARMLVPGRGDVTVASTVEEACDFLEPKLDGVTRASLFEAIEEARRVEREERR